MDLSEKSCLLLPLILLAAIGEKSVVQLLLSSYFRLPTSFWDFRLFSTYRRPPEDILATTFQFFSPADVLSEVPPTDVLLRFPPTDVLSRTFRRLFKKSVKKISILVYNMSEFESIWRNCSDTSAYRGPSEISTYRRPSENLPTSFLKICRKNIYTSTQYLSVFGRNLHFFCKICSIFRIFKWIFIPIRELSEFFSKYKHLLFMLNQLWNFQLI